MMMLARLRKTILRRRAFEAGVIRTEDTDGGSSHDRRQRSGLCVANSASASSQGSEDEGGEFEVLGSGLHGLLDNTNTASSRTTYHFEVSIQTAALLFSDKFELEDAMCRSSEDRAGQNSRSVV